MPCCAGAAGGLGAVSEGSPVLRGAGALGACGGGRERSCEALRCRGAATCGPAGAGTLWGGRDSVGVLDWGRAEMDVWRGCRGWPGVLLRPWEGDWVWEGGQCG